MSGRRILLTGGAGFVGSHLLGALLSRGDSVTVVDNFDPFYDPAEKHANIQAFLSHPGFELLEGDVTDAGLWAGLDPDDSWSAVLHVAARAGVRPSIQDPVGYIETNVGGTVQALSFATSASRPIPFVLASSSSVYGDSLSVPFAEEASVLAPVSPYAASKVGAEEMVRAWRRSYGLPAVSLRFFTVYGPRQRPDLAIRKFVRLMILGEPIPIFGDGSSARDYTHVSDVVSGTLTALDLLIEGQLPSSVYNLGSDRTVSLDRLVSILEEATGIPAKIERLPMQTGDVRRTWADLGRAESELNYRPAKDFEEGIREFVAWLRARMGQP